MNDISEEIAVADLMAISGVGFGTSGARGLADAMTDRVCYLYTVGFLQYLQNAGSIRVGDAVAVAGDLRPSSPRIMAAAAAAILDLGYRPVNCGRIPTPALACYAFGERIASLMVTGSHIPDDRNGIKFNTPGGEVLKADEVGIRKQVVRFPRNLFDDRGRFTTAADLPAEDATAYRRYIARYLDFFSPACLAGSRVLVYEHSTVAAAAMSEIFAGLGAEVLRRGFSDQFIPVDTEAVRAEDVALAQAWAGNERVDMLVSADGDGDRPLVGDERGAWMRGDVAGILSARFLGADGVVTPVSSNTALEKSAWFPRALRTRIGSPFVIEGMQALAREGGQRVVGYEANGGFLTMTALELDGRRLDALPTRDALIVPITLLLLARRDGVPLSQLATLLPPRFTASQRLQNFPTELSSRHIGRLAEHRAAIVEQFPSLGRVTDIDRTDGLRVTFENDEVVHLRPSGNAPELRCYTEADSAARAQALNAECLGLLDAWRE